MSNDHPTPPMTDSKTPEWAREAAQAFHDKWEAGMSGPAFRDFAQALAAVDQRAYARGIGEAAEVADGFEADAKTTNRSPHRVAEDIATAIRQLLEVKG